MNLYQGQEDTEKLRFKTSRTPHIMSFSTGGAPSTLDSKTTQDFTIPEGFSLSQISTNGLLREWEAL